MLPDPIRGQRPCALGAVLILFALTACASRPGPEVLVPVAAAPGSKALPIYVATARKRATSSENVFTAERDHSLNFAKFTVGIPPNHQAGNIEWPQGTPDPRVSFVTIDQALLSDAQFRDAVAPLRQSSRQRNKTNVLIFVHGFNNNFQESLYRLAQIASDAEVNGIPILFSWPSQAAAVQYAADKDAAAHSRDHLIALLTMVASSPQVGEVMIVAHSMGGMLTMESLRELRVQRRDRVIARLGRVVLAAPDIDVDAFRSQIQIIGPLNPPLTMLVSKDDAALRLSSFLGGSRVQAGALDVENPLVREAALKAKVRIIDISQLRSTDGRLHHDRFVNAAAFYPQLQRLADAERQQSGAFVFDPASVRPLQASAPAPVE